MHRGSLPLWPVPLLVALVPFVAAHLALHRYRQIIALREGGDSISKRLSSVMLSINMIMLALGIAYTIVANAFDDDMLKDRMENLLECHIGLLMTGWNLLQTVVW